MDSRIISNEIEGLEDELTKLRARVEEDSSSFATLEQQVAELRERLLYTRESVSQHEQRLESKQRELDEARRLEALSNYKQDLESHDHAAVEVTRAATDFLAVLEAYDEEVLRLRKLVEEMRRSFGDDERVQEVQEQLAREPEELRATWESLVAATRWRIGESEDEPIETEAEDLGEDLQKLAQERRRARIKEYFGKS
jgi:predicted  nucleic acid-binding Zn-ribbon protein